LQDVRHAIRKAPSSHRWLARILSAKVSLRTLFVTHIGPTLTFFSSHTSACCSTADFSLLRASRSASSFANLPARMREQEQLRNASVCTVRALPGLRGRLHGIRGSRYGSRHDDRHDGYDSRQLTWHTGSRHEMDEPRRRSRLRGSVARLAQPHCY